MRPIFKFLALAIIAGLSGALVTIIFHLGFAPSSGHNNDVNYNDFLSITLTALSLMITILGFFVAAAGVIGWTTIENKLRDHSISYFKKQLESNGKLREDIEKLIEEVTYRGVENYRAQRGIGDGSGESAGEGEYND